MLNQQMLSHEAILSQIHTAGFEHDRAALLPLQRLARTHEDPHVRAYAAWADWEIDPERPIYRTWLVDPKSGNDQAAGESNSKLRTIGAALMHARPGDTVLLAEGRYHETIQPWLGGTAAAPLIIEAVGAGIEIVAHEPWNPSWEDEGDGCWSTPYRRLPWDVPEAWENPGSNIPANRCEQIWCDDQLLIHRAGMTSLYEHKFGFLTVDNSGHQGGRLWLRIDGPPHGRIARSIRRQGLCPLVRGLGHLILRGLKFTGGAAAKWTGSNWDSHDQDAVVAIRGGHHWLIEHCDIGFGDAQGIEIGVGGFSSALKKLPLVWADPTAKFEDIHKLSGAGCGGSVVRKCKVHDHAIAGIVGIGATDQLRITGCDVDRNGRKDNDGTCEEAGIKIHSARDCLIDGNRVRWNRAYGIWLDCDCERNRITGNLLIDNHNHQLFHEISSGPAWFDSNVVIDTRGRGTGFYTHDGSHCLIANNVFRGCATGVRIRALFHRQHRGVSTRTCHNRIANNLIEGATAGAISMMPEKPRNEGNFAASNVYWLGGASPLLRLENTGDVGVQWEDTAYGRATGVTGGGDAVVDLTTWQNCFNQDLGATIFPASLLLGDTEPATLLDHLKAVSLRLGLGGGMPSDWNPLLPGATVWIDLVTKETGTDARGLGIPTLVVEVGPTSGFLRWDVVSGSRWLIWDGDAVSSLPSALIAALARTRGPGLPVLALAMGEQATVRGDVAQRVLFAASGLTVEKTMDGLSVSVDEDARPGLYQVIITDDLNWFCLPVRVTSSLSIGKICGDPQAVGNRLSIELHNHAGASAAIRVDGRIRDQVAHCTTILPPHASSTLFLPLSANDAGEAVVTVHASTGVLHRSSLVAFALAEHDGWGTTQDLNAFPGGCYPDGAWAFVLYQGTLRATWRARWDRNALHVEIRCVHVCHQQVRSDPHGWHTGSAAFISVRPGCGRPGTEIGLALRSDTGEALCGFRKSIDTDHYPIAPTTFLPFSINRVNAETLYQIALPWSVLGAASAPEMGTDLPFSVMVSQKDGGDLYGLQWFFGIEYGQHENDEAWMGRLRLS